ncbi:MAG: glycosyltransferase [Alphaproteobacteria bacterium]|nr:glycosyltransferase [Alphaproteobacteria bacterium]
MKQSQQPNSEAKMQVLFLHNNFPAQFGGLAGHLVDHGWKVWFGTQRQDLSHPRVNTFHYTPHREPSDNIHPYSGSWEKAVINGQSVARACIELKRTQQLNPDIVVSHSGWGPGLFVKDIWPEARTIGYFEWYYNSPGPDVSFLDPTPPSYDQAARSRARNAPILLDLASVDIGICPTHWQKSQFPATFDAKLLVHHDGVDTQYFRPDRKAPLSLKGVELPADAEIVTYVARGMEPYRGFPQFMAALAVLQAERPELQAVIVGEDRVAYGKKLAEGDSHLKRALSENAIDAARTHFVGYLSRDEYRRVLAASSAHVYLTTPFVLSWSMMEAMAMGCALVGSDTAPVREVANESNAFIVDFHDRNSIVAGLRAALTEHDRSRRIRSAARRTIENTYAAERLLAEKRRVMESLVAARAPAQDIRKSA